MASGVLEDLGYKATFCPHQDESERLWESRNCFLRCGCWDPGTRIYMDLCFVENRQLLIPLQVYQRSWLAETAHSRTPGQKMQGGFGKHSK